MRSERESEKLEDEGSIPSRPTRGNQNGCHRIKLQKLGMPRTQLLGAMPEWRNWQTQRTCLVARAK